MNQLADYGPLGVICAILLGGYGIGLLAIAAWLKSFIATTEDRHSVERKEWRITLDRAVAGFTEGEHQRRQLATGQQAMVLVLAKMGEQLTMQTSLLTDHCKEVREDMQHSQQALTEIVSALRRLNGR